MNAGQVQLAMAEAQKHVHFKPSKEFRIVALREASPPYKLLLCETPEHAVEYWRQNVATAAWFEEDQECFVAIFLDAGKRVIGHHLVSIGPLEQMIVHPREAFHAAMIAAAHSVVFMHNHRSDDETPSQGDIAVTGDFVRAGELLRINVVDHIVLGNPNFASLRQLGWIE